MTLYSKWDKGKNIMFLSGVVMLLCLFFSWIGVKDLEGYVDLGRYIEAIKNLLSTGFDLGEEGAEIHAIIRAYNASNWRWILLLPMAYPVYCLFATKYNKNICCVSAIVAVIVAIILLICGFRYMSFAAWLFIIASIVFFAGTAMAKPGVKVPSVPQAPIAPAQNEARVAPPTLQTAGTDQAAQAKPVVYCPQCGKENPGEAGFCSQCGASLK